MTFLTHGTADRTEKTGQTNILKAQLWKLTLTRTPLTLTDPRAVELFENWKLALIRTPDTIRPTRWALKRQLSVQRLWRHATVPLCAVACFLRTEYKLLPSKMTLARNHYVHICVAEWLTCVVLTHSGPCSRSRCFIQRCHFWRYDLLCYTVNLCLQRALSHLSFRTFVWLFLLPRACVCLVCCLFMLSTWLDVRLHSVTISSRYYDNFVV